MMEDAKAHFHNNFFMEVFIIGAWLIWKQRNDWIFNRSRPSFQSWKLGFIKEVNLQATIMNDKKKFSFLSVVQLYSSLDLFSLPFFWVLQDLCTVVLYYLVLINKILLSRGLPCCFRKKNCTYFSRMICIKYVFIITSSNASNTSILGW
jgi:hypothetical protein